MMIIARQQCYTICTDVVQHRASGWRLQDMLLFYASCLSVEHLPGFICCNPYCFDRKTLLANYQQCGVNTACWRSLSLGMRIASIPLVKLNHNEFSPTIQERWQCPAWWALRKTGEGAVAVVHTIRRSHVARPEEISAALKTCASLGM